MLHPGTAGLVLLLTLAAGARDRTDVQQLAWLAGCWERTGASSRIDEQWMAPYGGTMPGMSRTVRGGRTVAYEALRIYEREDRLVYAAHPSGQTPTEFVSTVVGADSAVFENPAHDFPQRISYRPAGDSLFARIEGIVDGVARGSDFRFARGECGSAGTDDHGR
jgi:hypothetical protein